MSGKNINIAHNPADAARHKAIYGEDSDGDDIWSDDGSSISPKNSRDLDMNGKNIIDLGNITMENSLILAENIAKKTMCINTGIGLEFCIGQGQYTYVTNNSGVDIDKGEAVSSTGILAGKITVAKAQADTYLGIGSGLAIAAMDIPDGTDGFATQFAEINSIDTTTWTGAPILYVSATTAGELTNVRPQFPNYAIQVGAVILDDASGVISIDIKGDKEDTFHNFFNGTFRESFDFRVTSNGTVITGTLSPTNGNVDMTCFFNSGFYTFDVSPPATIALTAGTDEIPQLNYIYLLESTKAITVSTSEWSTAEHIKIATVVLQSAATTETEGALKVHNWNDHLQTLNGQGHLSHICEKLRQFEAQWDNGIEGSTTIGAADEVWFNTTSGDVFQMHKQAFLAHSMVQYEIDAVSTGLGGTFTIADDGDLTSLFPVGKDISIHNSSNNDGMWTVASVNWSSPNFVITVESDETVGATADGTIGDDCHVVNDFTTSYLETIDLAADVTLDASGGALANSSCSVVVWGVANKTGEPSHLMANMPSDTYGRLSPDDAVADALNYSIYTIPKSFQGVGFLIMRVTFQITSGGVWSVYDTENLRGKVPNVTAGGGAGGTGVTTYLGLSDTPSAYTNQAGKFTKVNAGETALEFVTQEGGYTTTATAAGTTTLTVSSNRLQRFTGVTTQTIAMPVVSTLLLGQTWRIINDSTGILTVQSSGTDTIMTIGAGEKAVVTCVALTGTDETSWSFSKNLSDANQILYGVKSFDSEIDAQEGIELGGRLNLGEPTELTISVGGAITITKSFHRVDTNADAATDDLVNILGGNSSDMLIIYPEDGTRTVVVKNTGNIRVSGGVDYTMDSSIDSLTLILRDTVWIETGRGKNG